MMLWKMGQASCCFGRWCVSVWHAQNTTWDWDLDIPGTGTPFAFAACIFILFLAGYCSIYLSNCGCHCSSAAVAGQFTQLWRWEGAQAATISSVSGM